MTRKTKPQKFGNPVARALRSPHLKARRLPSKKLYSRKGSKLAA